jgi:hypothetical protein
MIARPRHSGQCDQASLSMTATAVVRHVTGTPAVIAGAARLSNAIATLVSRALGRYCADWMLSTARRQAELAVDWHSFRSKTVDTGPWCVFFLFASQLSHRTTTPGYTSMTGFRAQFRHSRISFLPKRPDNSLLNERPMMRGLLGLLLFGSDWVL